MSNLVIVNILAVCDHAPIVEGGLQRSGCSHSGRARWQASPPEDRKGDRARQVAASGMLAWWTC
jgi:hypothetical protein